MSSQKVKDRNTHSIEALSGPVIPSIQSGPSLAPKWRSKELRTLKYTRIHSFLPNQCSFGNWKVTFSGKVEDRNTQNSEVLIDHLLPFSMRPRSHGENSSTQRLMWHHGVRTNFTAFDVISQVRFQVALIAPRCYAWYPWLALRNEGMNPQNIKCIASFPSLGDPSILGVRLV